MLLRECFTNFVRMNYMFYPHSFACTTLKIPSQYFALSSLVQILANSHFLSFKTDFVRFHYLALCDFFYTTPKIHLKYFALSTLV